MSGKDDYTNQYAIAHPVKSMFFELLDALGAVGRAGLRSTVIVLGGGGANSAVEADRFLKDALTLEVEIASIFSADDFAKVFPEFHRESIFSDARGLGLDLDDLTARMVRVRDVCEKNHWFEDEGHRPGARDYPSGKGADEALGKTEWDNAGND